MPERRFDRDTLLDLTVNVIPLIIILFFIVLYTFYRPLGWDDTTMLIVYALHVIPFVGLAALTYLSARVISRDEGNTATPAHGGVGETPRTHRDTGDSSVGADGDGVAVEPDEDENTETTTHDDTATTDDATATHDDTTENESTTTDDATTENESTTTENESTTTENESSSAQD